MDEKKSNSSVENWSKLGERATFNNSLVTFKQQGSAYGEKRIEYGQHEWSIKSTFSSKSCQWVGISSDTSVTNSAFTAKPNSILWCCKCSKIQGNIGNGFNGDIASIESWNSGDVIKVKLDLDKKTVEFYKNDDKKPVYTYVNLPVDQYHIAIYGYNTNSFQIMESKSIGISLVDNILLRFKYSKQLLNKFKNSTDDMSVEQLIQSKKDVKKMLLNAKQYFDELSNLEKHLDGKINPDKKKYKSWGVPSILCFICSLENGKYTKYLECLSKEMKKDELTGDNLAYIEKTDLRNMGVNNFSDRHSLVCAIKKLTNGGSFEGNTSDTTNCISSNNNGNDDEEGKNEDNL